MEQFDIRADKNRNRFCCLLKGFFLESEIDLAFDRISAELKNLTDGFDVILDIQNLQTRPESLKDLFYERLKKMIEPDCRYIFKVTNEKTSKTLKKPGKSAHDDHRRIRPISNIREAEDLLEGDFLIKNIIYN
jgi:hypothetical protein